MGVNTGILEYHDTDDLLTRVVWTTEDAELIAFKNRVYADGGIIEAESCAVYSDERTYCGTANPVSIKWKGERYSVSAPSSIAIRLLIEDDLDRAFLEPIFNGGYTVTVYKENSDGNEEVFWKGRLTSNLSIEAYKQYPYQIILNGNDGLTEAKERQFLMIDFPNPWPTSISLLNFIGKFISLNLYPNDVFKLNVATRVYDTSVSTLVEDIYLDPRVFMEDDADEYISLDKVLDSVLGPLNLQLVQWKGAWWLLALDAQWDAGKITYTSYGIANNEAYKLGEFTDELGILDLYEQFKGPLQGDREVLERATIDFIPPWKTVFIEQAFQINSNILPFANRTGSFYYGHTAEGNSQTTLLEFDEAPFVYPPLVNNLRHWTGSAPTAPRPGNSVGADFAPYKFNAGAVWMRAVKETDNPESDPPYGSPVISVSVDLDDDVEFSRFTFTLNTLPTYKGVINATSNQFAMKKWIEIRYTTKSGIKYYFWNRWYESDQYNTWDGSPRLFRYDYKELSIDNHMIDDMQTGGNFIVNVYEPRDEHAYGPDYGVLYQNLTLGIQAVDFIDTFVWENPFDRERRARIRKGLAITGSLLHPVPMTTALHLINDNRIRKEEANKAAGNPLIRVHTNNASFDWDNTIKVDINPKGEQDLSITYLWGLDIPGIDSYHDLHMSSPYDSSGAAIPAFSKAGENGTKALLTWKSEGFINQNMEYTSALSGTYKSDNISPLQLVNDFEGRVYKFTKGTWHDKTGFWDTQFTEFKELQNIDGLPIKCDFSPFDFNYDFCTELDGDSADFYRRVEADGGTVEAITCITI